MGLLESEFLCCYFHFLFLVSPGHINTKFDHIWDQRDQKTSSSQAR